MFNNLLEETSENNKQGRVLKQYLSDEYFK